MHDDAHDHDPPADELDGRAQRRREQRRAKARRRRTGGEAAGPGHSGSRHSPFYRLVVTINLVVAVGTIVGMVLLWPDGSSRRALAELSKSIHTHTVAGKLTRVERGACQYGGTCIHFTAQVLSGADAGHTTTFQTADQSMTGTIHAGDRVRLISLGATQAGTPGGARAQYTFADFERRTPMLVLAAIFCALVLLTSRRDGLMALVGLAASLMVVIFFVVPALLDGRSPTLVAVVSSFAVMFLTISLSHGIGLKSHAALLGTITSLALTIALALVFTKSAHLSGLSSEEAVLLKNGGISVQGLVLAGMVVGALGVLDDVTVTQASAVMALRRANPSQRFRQLFVGAHQIGRDHIAATVNTLVLAYAGASLTSLLIFHVGNTSFSDALNNEVVAEAVVAMLVGSIGLLAAVPVTTAVAALLATHVRTEELPPDHVHVH